MGFLDYLSECVLKVAVHVIEGGIGVLFVVDMLNGYLHVVDLDADLLFELY